jgi:glutamine amidotransferase
MSDMTPSPSAPPRPLVTVIDAGVGNLGNLRRALAHLGAEVRVADDAATVAASRCLVLPGVGAFSPPRQRLRGALEEAIHAALDDGAYLLGICVGFQLLFESSTEFGETDGLGLLPGRVSRLPDSVPLPHIGWNRLLFNHAGAAAPPLVAALPAESWVYFVHSFAPDGVPEELVLARSLHGRAFPAVVGHGRVMGTQFHPEKSGRLGLRLLDGFLCLASADGAGVKGEA